MESSLIIIDSVNESWRRQTNSAHTGIQANESYIMIHVMMQ